MTENILPETPGAETIKSVSPAAGNFEQLEQIDQLHTKLSHLHAMLTITYGSGAETFQNWSEEIQDNYMWACATLADECKEFAELILTPLPPPTRRGECRDTSARKTQGDGDAHSGAMAGMNALRNIERIAEHSKPSAQHGGNLSMDDWWKIHDDTVSAMHSAAGKQGAFVDGFLASIAEYILATHTSGMPNLDKWTPEATMTETEKLTSRARFTEEVTVATA